MHRKEYQMMHAVKKARELRRLNKLTEKKFKKGDIIFWKGHVAIILSKHQLIHAYGPLKKTITMPIKKTIDRIYKTANLKVLGIRRIV